MVKGITLKFSKTLCVHFDNSNVFTIVFITQMQQTTSPLQTMYWVLTKSISIISKWNTEGHLTFCLAWRSLEHSFNRRSLSGAGWVLRMCMFSRSGEGRSSLKFGKIFHYTFKRKIKLESYVLLKLSDFHMNFLSQEIIYTTWVQYNLTSLICGASVIMLFAPQTAKYFSRPLRHLIGTKTRHQNLCSDLVQ